MRSTARSTPAPASPLLAAALALAPLLPGCAGEAPDEASATAEAELAPAGDAQCFVETGYCIRGKIREYWSRNGGLPVFGFPLGPERTETSPGGFRGPTQWFERDRLEDHGTKGVLAGRLGAEHVQTTPPGGVPKEPTGPGECQRFDETRHTVCGPFLTFWKTRGGLERFGFPITGTLTEGGRLVQYFERRRMELAPSGAVELGLLGTALVEREKTTKAWAIPRRQKDLGELARTFAQHDDSIVGDYSVAVVDLQTGERVDRNGARAHKTASSLKFFMMSAAMKAMERGALKPSDRSGGYTPFPAMEEMIRVSTNPPGTALTALLGGDAALNDHLWNDLGMSRASCSRTWGGGDARCPVLGGAVAGNNRFTANDVVGALAKLVGPGAPYARARSEYLLSALALWPEYRYLDPRNGAGARTLLPAARAVRVGEKVGWVGPEVAGPLHQAVNSLAVVSVDDCKATKAPIRYAIAVLVQTNRAAATHTPSDAAALVGKTSLAVFDWFDAAYGCR